MARVPSGGDDRRAAPLVPTLARLRLILLSAVGGALVTAAAAVLLFFGRNASAGLPVIGLAPHYRLVDQNGRSVSSQDFAGKVRIVAPVFPYCRELCPLIAANLAQSFADAGQRTLLIDGDIRRGELDKRFEIERVPGLLDYIDGRATLDQTLRQTTSQLLWVLPRGSAQARGPELLVSPVVPNLITELQRRYEVIIVDSPPLGAGIDPFVLGSATSNLLLVLRAGESNRKLAEAKLKLLSRLPIRVLGVVLNNVRLRGDFQYYAYTYRDIEAKQEPVPSDSKVTELARRSGLSA